MAFMYEADDVVVSGVTKGRVILDCWVSYGGVHARPPSELEPGDCFLGWISITLMISPLPRYSGYILLFK